MMAHSQQGETMNAKKPIRVDQTLGSYYAVEARLQDLIGTLEEIRDSAECEHCGNAESHNVLTRAEVSAVELAHRMILRALSTKH